MEQFDPYHKWLGIPPAEQPPNHYRLLGISAFENDPDVIDAAANQRMGWLQDMAGGPHTENSQKLLNEISAALRCLLDAQAKAEYDASLRTQTGDASDASDSQSHSAEAAPVLPGAATETPSAPPETGRSSGEFGGRAETSAAVSSTHRRYAGSHSAGRPEGTDQKIVPVAMIASVASIGLVACVAALAMIFRNGTGAGETTEKAVFRVVWKLDEREGARMRIDRNVVFDSNNTMPKDSETLVYRLSPGEHRFRFDRDGYRTINYRYKFLPGESHRIELNWLKQ